MATTNGNKVCTTCNGTGHDKASKPVVKFEPEKQPDGSIKRVHTTIKQGSGCISCLGRGVSHV